MQYTGQTRQQGDATAAHGDQTSVAWPGDIPEALRSHHNMCQQHKIVFGVSPLAASNPLRLPESTPTGVVFFYSLFLCVSNQAVRSQRLRV